MAPDTLLHACALLELVRRLDGNTQPLDDYAALLQGEQCPHSAVALYLAGMLTAVSRETNFDLQTLIDNERAAALDFQQPEPGGMG